VFEFQSFLRWLILSIGGISQQSLSFWAENLCSQIGNFRRERVKDDTAWVLGKVPETLVPTLLLQLSMGKHHTLGVLSSETQCEDPGCKFITELHLEYCARTQFYQSGTSNLLFLVTNSLGVSGRKCGWVWLTEFDLRIHVFLQ
jgi:hypothetical protein